MDAPQYIRPSSDENISSVTKNDLSSTTRRDIERMIVPDRILVAGGRAIVGEKQPPPEIALDMHTLPPVRYTHKILETPPAKLTLQDRIFPSVVDEMDGPQNRLFQQRDSCDGRLESSNQERGRISAAQPSQADGLPPSSTLSLLSPAEEVVLLRNHVRKVTTRVMKLEEDVQSLNTHVGWLEGLGGALLIVFVLKSLKSVFGG